MSDRQQARAVLWNVLAKSKTRLKGVIVARYHTISLTLFHKPTASPSSGRSDLYVFNITFLYCFFFVIHYSALSISVLRFPCVRLYSLPISCNLEQRELRFYGWQMSLVLSSIPFSSTLPFLATAFFFIIIIIIIIITIREYTQASQIICTCSRGSIRRIEPPSNNNISRK